MTGPILDRLLSREREPGPHADPGVGRQQGWAHWRLASDENDVAWLLFDQQGAAVNVLSAAALRELGEILQLLVARPPRGLVLRSAKASNFCVGADLEEFRDLDENADIIARLEEAHAIANRLGTLPCPSIAVIHGTCLGGGLELALCCDYRLALPDAALGLPEIRLGLHPGLGGTARLTHLIDPVKAMTLMLTGKTLDAQRARKAGVVDQVIEERHVVRAVEAALAGRVARSAAGLKARLLTTAPARRLAARRMRAKSAGKAPPEHYPAPAALIDLWEHFGSDVEQMRRAEIPSFAKLLTGATAQNLVRVFFLREKMKKAAKSAQAPIRHVHVIGAGTMGSDIAGWCAVQGLRVSLHDTESAMLGRAVKKTAELCRAKHFSAIRTRDLLDRLIPDSRNHGIGQADLVIEAVPENIDIKRQVYRQIEPLLHPDALLATNTSSIPLEDLSACLANPARLVGLHFFNPVAKMLLVEVVAHASTDSAVLARAKSFVARLDRLPAPVSGSAGFLVNRALMPYLMEAIVLLDQGVAAEIIDGAAEAFGMPMGPLELADRVGLDICLAVAEMLHDRLDRPMAPIPQWFRDQIGEGRLGRKSGEGFYAWKNGSPRKRKKAPAADTHLSDRLLLPLLNTCMTCLQEGVVADEELLDAVIIFGTGFAPFRGGPMHYARSRGFAEIAGTLAELADRHGERFNPDPGWTAFTVPKHDGH